MTEELRHMAQHDPLTDLPNRAMFSHRLQHELERAKRHQGRFALIFLDLDHFKPINDHHGHGVGDRLLQQVARRLQGAVRASDTVGRIGGDEFVVLMPELGADDTALGLAEKIRQVVRESYNVEGHALTISCSLGVAVYPDDGEDEIALTKAADEAMYRAKAEGRDSVATAS
jgi:diguanylate cyclase (GGDEF)-like protein